MRFLEDPRLPPHFIEPPAPNPTVKRERLIHPDVTNNRFALAVERHDSSFDLNEITAIWSRYHVVEIRELPEAAT